VKNREISNTTRHLVVSEMDVHTSAKPRNEKYIQELLIAMPLLTSFKVSNFKLYLIKGLLGVI
jgi:hypothetical protein